MKITAVIPVRKGSERVIDKCTRPFSNTSLLEFKIQWLKLVPEIDEIVVNTDSPKAISIALEQGVNYHERDPAYASSNTPANEYFKHLGETTDCDLIAYTPVTSPFIKPETFSKCIQSYNYNEKNSSIVTATVLKHFLWKDGKPLNFELDKHPRSQDFNDISAINFGLCLIPRKTLIEFRSIIGPNPTVHFVSEIEGMDIDNNLDFFIAEQIYLKTVLNHHTI
ncbi:N-acylneuraminate cytidylyltransferase [Dyadobacter jejuensis]|uniref:N-acylneuraminate cytidylyltransferase n=1 Tax=Dyadobacter jejuensis TaxID=1082580 RepID=A0A316BD35_9BACT|nr:cytidylyltransferase [Dyadobacter jejuensis]PWJ60397.1 N-acylneuraminate cytidylyltransferase [Dyadobacter jejuensis]